MTHTYLKQYKEAVQDLYYWLQGQDFFTCKLYNLICKADSINRLRIAKGFPVEVAVLEDWEKSSNQNLFFKKYLKRG